MKNSIEVEFRFIPVGETFEFEGLVYSKTNHGRGYYREGSKMIFRNFKKRKIVIVEDSDIYTW